MVFLRIGLSETRRFITWPKTYLRIAPPPVSYSGRDEAIKESTSEKSADLMSKDDHHLAPSPSISPSVHGHRELGLSGDPSVKDLSIMDRSGLHRLVVTPVLRDDKRRAIGHRPTA